MKFYKVSEDTLRSLMEDAAFLESLSIAGVDSWSGYDYAQEIYQEGSENELTIPYEELI